MAPPMPVGLCQFDDVVRRVEHGLQQVERLVARIVADGEAALRRLGLLGHPLEAALRRLRTLAARIFDETRHLLAEPGDPLALWHAAGAWTTKVAAFAAEPTGTLTADYAHADDAWSGPAATAYLATLPPQHAALDRVRDVADQIAESLTRIAEALIAFWVALLAAVVTLVAELSVATAATATIAGAPSGLLAATGASSKFLIAYATLAGTLLTYLSTVAHEQHRLTAALTDNATFPGPPAGHWPRSTPGNLDDGSMTDGDDSAWRLHP
jgi:hypothetical protein